MISESLLDEIIFNKIPLKGGDQEQRCQGKNTLGHIWGTLDSWRGITDAASEIMWCLVESCKSFDFYSERDGNKLEIF